MSPIGGNVLSDKQLRGIEREVRREYRSFTLGLPFHGWHHVQFVRSRAVIYAEENGSDVSVVAAAALVHDLNYMVARNSTVKAGAGLRHELLSHAGVGERLIEYIEEVILQAETSSRDGNIGLEAQALSDADTVFKVLPTTPVLLAHRYMQETGQDLRTLCSDIVTDQVPLWRENIYFYNEGAKIQYASWASANLVLWECIHEALQTPEVQSLVELLEKEDHSRR